MEIAESYKSLRDQVFSLADGKIKSIAPTKDEIYAVLMETAYPEATFSLVAVSDGSASLYFSNGGGIVGAGQHQSVRKHALSFLDSAFENLKYTEKTRETLLAKVHHTIFYLITESGIYLADELESDLGNNKHKLSSLFHHGHSLITAIREIDEMPSAPGE